VTLERSRFLTLGDAFLNELSSIASVTGGVSGDREDRLHDELGSLIHSHDALRLLPMNEFVGGLCDLAFNPDPERSDLGQRLIFTSIVESLADSFEPEKVLLYDHFFARVIECCRRHHTGRPLDLILSRFGMRNANAILARKEQLKHKPPFPLDDRPRIKRAFVPSRVTFGADVAVTGLILQKIERVFPNAECVVFGPAAVGELLQAGSRATRFVDCPYVRRGGLMGRLGSWIQLVEAVHEEMSPHQRGECVFIDPDSRLTQLGLLPVVEADVPCFFFESRGYRRPGADTLGELTARWLDEVMGPHEGGPLYPRITLATSERLRAETMVQEIRNSANGHVTAVNLGVGGNPRKRISVRFELDLVRALVSEGDRVILDKGVGEEVARVEAIVSTLSAEGVCVAELTSAAFRNQERFPSGQLVIYEGGLGPFAALVAASDLYIGYDSAFQHVAAALSVPVIDVFVDPPNDLFPRRWQPHSKASVEVVQAAADSDGREALPRVLAAYRRNRAAIGQAQTRISAVDHREARARY